jgi:SAM-dependent methyltransferase
MPDEKNENITANPSEIWERIAGWWDIVIGEGNEFQQELIIPATDRLLALVPGEKVLDIACGNGNYARRLAAAGAKVVAFDGAATFIERARSRTAPGIDITYLVLDATDEPALLNLRNAGPFDAAVCSMAIMDLPRIDPLISALGQLLKPAGRFVFSISHPCFNSYEPRMTAELIESAGRLEQVYGVQITKYLSPVASLSIGIVNQPEPHYLFHRPLGLLLGLFFESGFVLDGLEEPAFPPGKNAKNAFSWAKRPDIPPAIVLRVRRA